MAGRLEFWGKSEKNSRSFVRRSAAASHRRSQRVARVAAILPQSSLSKPSLTANEVYCVGNSQESVGSW
jgi:hypothetical protein